MVWHTAVVATGREPSERQIEDYDDLRMRGRSQGAAAALVGLSPSWASRYEKARLPGMLRSAGFEVPAVALGLLNDFEGWRAAYLGHVSKPWMVEAADTVRRLLESPSPEFLVINCPPGAGKSTWLQDLFAWLLVRDRTLRAIYGADTETNATKATALIKSYLDAQFPPVARTRMLGLGQEVQATRVLAHDFGTFFDGSTLERRNEYTIVGAAAVKEASVTAYGRDSGVMGNRGELVGWDDLVTEDAARSPTANERLFEDWDGGLGESRLEPFADGLLFLVGQRIAPRDLFRYNLDKTFTEFVDGKEYERKQYTHIVFPAHFDDVCVGTHDPKVARSWPHGCLLDADRLPWAGPKGLGAKKRNAPRAYDIQYQQQDGTAEGALIEGPWIYGGTDSEGIERPGCLNRQRMVGQVPAGWNGGLSMVTVDPSGVNYWAVQWWLNNPVVNARALMRLIDRKMGANHLLDWDGERFTGVLEELWQESVGVGKPVTHVVVEVNAAQRYLTQMNVAKKWRESRKVAIVPHTTSRNKLDADLGLNILIEPFRSGWYDLPYADVGARGMTETLARQLTSYSERDDQKMAVWFNELWVHKLRRTSKPAPRLPRPSWLGGGMREPVGA